MTSDQIIKFLKDHPLISQRALETQVSMPQATLRHSMSGTRKIPQKYMLPLCLILMDYGLQNGDIYDHINFYQWRHRHYKLCPDGRWKGEYDHNNLCLFNHEELVYRYFFMDKE